mgnify:CR=1 FL=1
MGKNGLGKVFAIAVRSYMYFLSFGQSNIRHTKNILVTASKSWNGLWKHEPFSFLHLFSYLDRSSQLSCAMEAVHRIHLYN